MIFYFKNKTELEIVISFNEKTDKAQTETETFDANEKIDGDIVDDNGEYVNIQFPDGSMVYGVPRDSFVV